METALVRTHFLALHCFEPGTLGSTEGEGPPCTFPDGLVGAIVREESV